MPEMWAYCDPCGRSFYVPFSSGEEMSRTLCPVCSSEPANFEVRNDEASFDVDLSDDAVRA